MSNETTAEAFVRYHKSAASRLRYAQAQRNMEALHDLGSPKTVLDCAGGNGLNTAWLASLGHSVTLLDNDPEMLQQADARLKEMGLRDKCELVEGTLETFGDELPAGKFDLIVCHHAIEYTNEAPKVMHHFAKVLAPGGQVSLITINPTSEVVRAIIFRKDPVEAKKNLTDLYYDAKWFGDATMYTFDQVVGWAKDAGLDKTEYRAIRALADYLPQSELDDEKEAHLLEFEETIAGKDPYRTFGRYYQFCLTKPA